MEPDSPSEQRSALITLSTMATSALAQLWPRLREDEWAEGMEEVAALYGAAAGALAADWYELLREIALSRKRRAQEPPQPGRRALGVVRPLRIEPARLPTSGLYRAIAERIVLKPETALVNAQGELQKVVANAHRDTITQLSARDETATGWRRVGQGENCKFCQMLIGRGAVYKAETARFAAHPHCNCVAVPAFDGGRAMPALPYTRSSARMSDEQRARMNARAREWMATH